MQFYEYYEAYEHFGLTLNAGIYGSTFFMLTGFHGFHVFMGMTMLLIQLLRSVVGASLRPPIISASKRPAGIGTLWTWSGYSCSCSCIL